MGLFAKKKVEKKEEKKEVKLPPLPEIKKKPLLPAFPPLPKKPVPPVPPALPIAIRKPVTEEIAAKVEPEIAKLREPIFVKIDKFKDALNNFELINQKIKETTALLDKIRKIRGEEEEELNTWAKEIEAIKEKLDKIDTEIFSKVEH